MSATHRITIYPEEIIGTVSPNLHAHFAEHLGDCIYPGIWVGENSSLPNQDGLRSDVLEALIPLHIPILRWPGGCFADDYHWRDGIGAASERPIRVNAHWGMAKETNAFGTHEFIAFCRAIGAKPYFAANLGSASPTEMREWIEYCNFGGESSLASERAANGSAEPFRVRYWGIGNENWGCGGNMSPQQYAGEYARYRSFAFSYPDAPIEGIACGPNGSDWAWTRGFFDAMGNRKHMVQGFAAHYYCMTAGTATVYNDDQWLELLARAAAVEGIVTGHRAIMDEYDPDRKIPLILDEWGTWHPQESGSQGDGLWQQQSTLRDACVAAISLNIFNNHCDKLTMTNIAQLVNVLQSPLLVNETQCVKTPTYHVFDLFQPHKEAQAVRLISHSPTISDGGASREHCRSCFLNGQPLALPTIQGSASVKAGVLCATVVNCSPTETVEVALEAFGASLSQCSLATIDADDIHAHNDYDHPERVKIAANDSGVKADGAGVRIVLSPGSIARVMGSLR